MSRLDVFFLVLVISATNGLNNHTFPEGFSLGAATSSFQIEGAWNESGKGEQLWDWWMHQYPDKIENKANGDIACDSYHKWEQDVELLKNLGVNHYRMSISWSRILPYGVANNQTINEEGVRYYRNIFEALIAANITPYVTLYHWDLPISLHQAGGWLNVELSDHFANYARVCFQLFGDIVKNWITINEPHTYCVSGYGRGFQAPGYVLPGEGIYKCAYTSVLAHAKAYHVYDDEFRGTQNGRVSVVIDSPWFEPGSNSTDDVLAAEREFDFFFGLYANPIYNGNWPEQVIKIVDARSQLEGFAKSRLPKFTDHEISFIKGTSDFFSINSYTSLYVHHLNNYTEMIDPSNASFFSDQGVTNSADATWRSDVSWVRLVPWGFRKLLNYIHDRFEQPEIFVAENGWAQNLTTAGLQDQDRITYIEEYLSALLDAVYEDGVNVTGYTVWSLMDSLEWSYGLSEKLGLVQVDFDSENRTRTPRASFGWYQGVNERRCLVDDCV